MMRTRTLLATVVVLFFSAAGPVVAEDARGPGEGTTTASLTPEWVFRFGTRSYESPDGVAVDESGCVHVVGKTAGAFRGHANAGERQASVGKHDGDGNGIWTCEFGTTRSDPGKGVAVEASANARGAAFRSWPRRGHRQAATGVGAERGRM